MKKEIQKLVKEAVLALQKEGKLPVFELPEIQVDYPKDEKFGDYSTNIALVLAKKAGESPTEIGEKLKTQISKFKTTTKNLNFIGNIAVVSPGYLNFYLSEEYLQDSISVINQEKENFGNNNLGENKKVLVEFISSNPTGPIHLGNARGGPLGDTLANVLEKSGFEAQREFYVNDYGNQIEILGHSILKDSEAQYRGDYIDDLANKADKNLKNSLALGNWAANIILNEFIKPTSEKLAIKFDNWFSEKSLHDSGEADAIISLLKEKGLAYEKDGALWYRATRFGDDKDRVLVKSDGKKTYFAVDAAYHKNKFERGFDRLINIWGADHHGDVLRVKSVAEEVLGRKGKLDFIITQMVRVIKDGQEVKMSKRKGVYFAMDDLVEEVGKDAVRFIFVSYAPSSHINFDINLAKERSEKNPVYYAQYAHARICSILNKVKSEKLKVKSDVDLSLLTHEKELSLIRELNKFPELIEEIARNFEVHKLPHFAIKLADKFHSFYDACRVIDEKNLGLTAARLNLINAVRIVLAETLRLIGVSAPTKM